MYLKHNEFLYACLLITILNIFSVFDVSKYT